VAANEDETGFEFIEVPTSEEFGERAKDLEDEIGDLETQIKDFGLESLTNFEDSEVAANEVLAYDSVTKKFGPVPMLFFDPRSFGEIGTDDDTAVLEAVSDAVEEAGGGRIVLPIIHNVTEWTLPSNTRVEGPGGVRSVAANTEPYLIRNRDYEDGNENICLSGIEVDGNKSEIPGDRAVDTNPSALIRFVADDEHRCRNIRLEGVYQHDAKRLGCALANVEGGYVGAGTVFENNGRDGLNLQSNTSDINLDYTARGCGDDALGINAEQSPDLVHDLHDIRGRVVIEGPGDDGPGLGVTIRGARDIDLEIFVDGIEGWGLGIFDAYTSDAKGIRVRGVVKNSGGDPIFYSNAAVVLAAGVVHKAEGPYAAIEDVDLGGLKVQNPGAIGLEVKSTRGAYGSLEHIYLDGMRIEEATTAILLGDYLSHVVISRLGVRDVVNGLVSTASHVLRLIITNPDIYNFSGHGLKVENVSALVLTGPTIGGDGKNGQTGIRLKGLAGECRVADLYVDANNVTTPLDVSEAGVTVPTP
jgi:hypothetical protein